MTPLTPGVLILNACCVINIVAAGQAAAILRALNCPIMVSETVAIREALFIFDSPRENAPASKQRIALQLLVYEGVIGIAALAGENEQALFVALAARLDDGEAETAAIALHRQWALATDDLKALRLLQAEFAAPIFTTPDILKHWAETSHAQAEAVRTVLLSIEQRARYRPGARHPLYGWWQDCAGAAG